MECPKCQYIRLPSDHHVLAGVCPRCGIAYNKFRREKTPPPAPASLTVQEQVSPMRQMLNHMMAISPKTDEVSFWGRAVLWVLFALWGGSFIIGGVDWESIGGSFLHNVNLPFHEFGHVLFMPFGRFMAILGGSLFQIILPLIFLVAFSWQQRDNFAASIMLWWCGQNFIDVAPYIKDAPYRSLPLIMGMGEEAHDWGNLLTMTNSLDSATAFANTSFFIGSCLIIGALVWGALLLRKMKQQLLADAT